MTHDVPQQGKRRAIHARRWIKWTESFSHPNGGEVRRSGSELTFGVGWLALAWVLATSGSAVAEQPALTDVAPWLQRYCSACHGPDRQEGELRLDRLVAEADQPRHAARWRAVAERVRGREMPPADQPQPTAAERIAFLERIEERWTGAAAAREHWAFQPLGVTSPPATLPSTMSPYTGWSRNGVDAFILARMVAAKTTAETTERADRDSPTAVREAPTGEGHALSPSPEAERGTWLRRVTLDLIGLPPSPDEVAEFVADESVDAWERVVDRLLASPHYGERWGRHWLDLAQYADSSGFHNDLDRPYAWKYRDYVVRSFNADKPYPRFIAEQLAGDEIDGASDDSRIATGFCRNGPSNDDNMGKTPEALAQYRVDQLDNVVTNVGTVFLGLTIGCARCHHHKTEPLTSRDYYGMLAIFNGTQKSDRAPGQEQAAGGRATDEAAVAFQGLIETSARVPPTHVLRRGNVASPGEEVGAAVPAVLVREPLAFPQPPPGSSSSLRRRTLVEWLGGPNHGLVWRVLANRLWQHHFGRGLVATPGNLGTSGAAPTHPELLDWLAGQLVWHEGRWKPLHRLLVTSATYRQQSRHRPAAAALDPENQLWWRRDLRRLEAEAVRDSILAASGQLNRQCGGPGVKPRIRAELLVASQRNKWPALERESGEQWRRSIYVYVKRQLLLPLLELFDAPPTTDSCAVRLQSVVPTQALVLMNDDFTEDQARYLAERVREEGGGDLPRVITLLFQRTVSRVPDEATRQEALEFVRARETVSNRLVALTDLAHVLFNSSEFLYVE